MLDFFARHYPAEYWDKLIERALETSFDVARILVIYVVIRWLIGRVSKNISGALDRRPLDSVNQRRVETVRSLTRSALLYVLAIVTVIMLLQSLGINTSALITAAGVGGLAVGFGAQRLVRDIIGGFLIMMENQFSVGESVTLAGVTGIVCEVGLRTTRLRDSQGKLYIFANGDITTVCNHSRGELIVPLEINVAASADVSHANAILDEIGREISDKYKLNQPYQSQGVVSFDSAKVTLRLVGGVSETLSEKVTLELKEAIYKRFSAEEIPIV